MGYDEEAVNAFRGVRKAVDSLALPMTRQRRYDGLLNAIEMQVEAGPVSRESIRHLRAALLALVTFDGAGKHKPAIQKAFDEFEKEIESRLS